MRIQLCDSMPDDFLRIADIRVVLDRIFSAVAAVRRSFRIDACIIVAL